MQRSEIVASAAGPTAPILVLGGGYLEDKFYENIASLYMLQPTAWAHLSPGAVSTWQYEITTDLPDANGNWPSPGNWLPYQDGTVLPHTAGYWIALTTMITAIRVNVLTLTGGTLTFRVLQ